MSKFSTWLQKHVLFKVAEKLIVEADTLDLDNNEDERCVRVCVRACVRACAIE